MISFERRDGSEKVGLGFCGGGEMKMEDFELEEGEACFFDNNDDNNKTTDHEDYNVKMDPEVDLSYIDEKLEHCLGHFQKDFEGPVSTDMMGCTFGGYGSFLPTYQRSPSSSDSRALPKDYFYTEPRFSNDFELQASCHSLIASSIVPQSVKPKHGSICAASLPALKESSSKIGLLKQEMCKSSRDFDEKAPTYESISEKSDNKLLKVRIKVGSDNLLTRKNAAIYSGRGLEISPSSTPEESPSGCEGMPHGPWGSLESLAHILQVMLSPFESLLLSPLPDDILQLTEKERPPQQRGFLVLSSIDSESRGIVSNSSYFKASEKVLEEKKMRSLEINESLAELKSEKNQDGWSATDGLPNTKLIDDSFNSEKLLVDSSKFPLQSISYNELNYTSKPRSIPSKEAFKCIENSKNVINDPTTEEPFMEELFIDNVKTASGNVREAERVGYTRKSGLNKFDKSENMDKKDTTITKQRKDVGVVSTDSLKQKTSWTHTYDELEGMDLSSGRMLLSSDERKISKGANSCVASEAAKESGVVSSPITKSKKSASADDKRSKVEMETVKPQKSYAAEGEKYRDFFGDMDVDQENQLSPSKVNFGFKAKVPDAVGKIVNTKNLKGRTSFIKAKKPLASEAFLKPSSVAVSSETGTISDTAPPDDRWVCCDECQKWRLVPLVENPDLTNRWTCSMMYWLPGMNRCSISQEETTTAVMALIPVLPAESNGMPPVVKKKHGSKESSSYKTESGLNQLSDNVKTRRNLPVIDGNFSGPKHPRVSSDVPIVTESGGLAAEGHKFKKKEKRKLFDKFSEEGDAKYLKGSGEPGQDILGASKNIRSEDLLEDFASDLGSQKVFASSTAKYDESTPSVTKHNKREQFDVSMETRKDRAWYSEDSGSLDVGEHGNSGARKRKAKGSNFTGNDHQELGKNSYGKEKKARLTRSDEKEFGANGRMEKSGSRRKSQPPLQNPGSLGPLQSLDGGECLKRDSGSIPTSTAATSSSSKVSSHKIKANHHDTRGSPVESVSSSPIRASGPDRLLAMEDNLSDKDGSTEALDAQRCCSNGGIVVGLRSEIERKKEFPDVANHGSGEASDFQDEECNGASSVKARVHSETSPDRTNFEFLDGGSHVMGHNTQYPNKSRSSDQCQDNERENDGHYRFRASRLLKSGKEFYSRSKDKNMNSTIVFCSGSTKVESINGHSPSSSAKPMDNNGKIQKFMVKSDENVDKHVDNKDSSVPLSNGIDRKSYSQVSNSQDVKQNSHCNHDSASTPKKTSRPDCEGAPTGRKASFPPPSGAQSEALVQSPQLIAVSCKVNESNSLTSDAFEGDNASKALNKTRRVGHNGTHHNSFSNGHRVKDYDAPSSVKRDSSSQAANNALKEAKNLKHMADRLKNKGLHLEGARLHFEASLKFLHGASVLETCGSENTKTGEMTQSIQIYSDTAKFCEFCAHEYEKSKDMAAAALAYKCAEVAYLRVINFSSTFANRDQRQLRLALQMIPPGESPSSSASDIDNINHPTSRDKVSLGKGICSPQLTGNHVIAAQNRPIFVRVLNFVQNVNSAMDASRKSWAAYAAANANVEEAVCKEGMACVKTALDFGFQDVEGLLRLMRVASEAITR